MNRVLTKARKPTNPPPSRTRKSSLFERSAARHAPFEVPGKGATSESRLERARSLYPGSAVNFDFATVPVLSCESAARQSEQSPVHPILRLQRTIGNQAVVGLLRSGVSQAKLAIGRPSDRYEQEADRVANQVMRMPKSECPECEEEIAAPADRGRFRKVGFESSEVYRNESPGARGAQRPPRIEVLSSSGRSLDPDARGFMELRFGYDFGDVRVHTDQRSAKSARALNAQAYTSGTDIVFGAGEYAPHTSAGRRLLAHELTHVIQQRTDVQGQHASHRLVQRQNLAIGACRPTARLPGDLDWPGTQEHLIIQQYYISSVNPMAVTEYMIPGSGPNGGIGYADIADPIVGEIYEIKFHGVVERAVPEVLRYVAQANVHCHLVGSGAWVPGVRYPPAVLPFTGNQEIVSWLSFPGVISYFVRQRSGEPVPVPAGERGRQLDRKTALERIRQFVDSVVEGAQEANEAAREFLRNNPQLVDFIKGLLIGVAITIVVATIIEDIATLGAGLVDDPASFAAALALFRVARSL